MSIIAAFHGLTAAQVLEQRRKYGENRSPLAKRTSAWAIFFGQFKNPLIYLILAAAAAAVIGGLLVAIATFPTPRLRQVLEIVPLHLADWMLVMGVAVALLVVVEIGKANSNNRLRQAAVRDTPIT